MTRWQVYDWRKKLIAGALALPAGTVDEPMFAALVLDPESSLITPSQKQRSGGWKALVFRTCIILGARLTTLAWAKATASAAISDHSQAFLQALGNKRGKGPRQRLLARPITC